jgi:ubiquinone/menaquinone biosynthesis C-methylase UbiE
MPSILPTSAAVYSPFVIRYAYDAWVLGVSNHFAWRVPTSRLRKHFEGHAQARHLEASAGTGYFPDRCRFPVDRLEITLVDVNPHCLAAAAKRLGRFCPKTVLADLTAPLPLQQEGFQSIHMGYLFHCLPGPMEAKGSVLKNLRPLLHPDGCLFGSTLLPDGGNAFARCLTKAYNRKGIFGNAGDTMEGLEAILSEHFSQVTAERVGQAVLFAARKF